MPVNTKHPKYGGYAAQWQRIRDCVAGEDAVKAGGEVYLPKLSEQKADQYAAYLKRALFYGASGRTVQGLVGAILRKEPKVEFPDEEFLDHIGKAKESLGVLLRNQLKDQVSVGRVFLLVDAAEEENAEPFVLVYAAECCINWREAVVDGRRQPVMIVLEETVDVIDPKDEFSVKKEVRWRVLKLDQLGEETPVYRQQIWVERRDEAGNKRFVMEKEITPKMRGGKTFTEIPGEMINPDTLGVEPDKSAILDLVDVNLSHFRNSADLEHGLHFTGLPTPWIAGVDTKQDFVLGSEVAWIFSDPEAKAQFLEYTGQGLVPLSDRMSKKEQLMAILGARLLEEQKKDSEAAETVRLRQAGEAATLGAIANTASLAWTRILRFVALWRGAQESALKKIGLVLNRDFDTTGMDPALLTQLMLAVQQGQISWNTFFYNVKKFELIPDDINEEEEASLIQAGPPMGKLPSPKDKLEAETAARSAPGGGAPSGGAKDKD